MLLPSCKSFRNRSQLPFAVNHNERCPPRFAESGPAFAVCVADSLRTNPQPFPALRGSVTVLRAFAVGLFVPWQGGGLHE